MCRLHTLRADIDYATAEGATTYGVIGVKVWIFKGEIIGSREESAQAAAKKGARRSYGIEKHASAQAYKV